MIITFITQLQGINWIAEKAPNEQQFEILREELLFNYIYSGRYFLDIEKVDVELFAEMPLWKLGHN